jgi:hypothetical protein
VGHYNSFLVRIWTDNEDSEIRGFIQHVGARESIYFTSWEKLVEFVSSHLGWRIDQGPEEEEEQILLNSQGEPD